jgi:ubiquinone/menaquinone biosynthesis C-methylase UbiE
MLPPVEELEFGPIRAPLADSKPRLHETIAGRTRRMYDLLAGVYPASTYFFHSNAHQAALEMSGVADGMRVLEIATGSGEMFRRLAGSNRNGQTLGIDISPRMAAKTQRSVRTRYPGAKTHCHAVDARHLPFRDESFDAIFCCYLFELLGTDDIVGTLEVIRRVLRPKSVFTTILIGQNSDLFNKAYQAAASVIPSFWGRQVEASMPATIEGLDFTIVGDHCSRQSLYPSRVLCCRKG